MPPQWVSAIQNYAWGPIKQCRPKTQPTVQVPGVQNTDLNGVWTDKAGVTSNMTHFIPKMET